MYAPLGGRALGDLCTEAHWENTKEKMMSPSAKKTQKYSHHLGSLLDYENQE